MILRGRIQVVRGCSCSCGGKTPRDGSMGIIALALRGAAASRRSVASSGMRLPRHWQLERLGVRKKTPGEFRPQDRRALTDAKVVKRHLAEFRFGHSCLRKELACLGSYSFGLIRK